jgi:hypothetical protein
MDSSRNIFILKAMVFKMILWMQLHSEMGLKSSKVSILPFFGIRDNKVDLKEPNTLLVDMDSSSTM